MKIKNKRTLTIIATALISFNIGFGTVYAGFFGGGGFSGGDVYDALRHAKQVLINEVLKKTLDSLTSKYINQVNDNKPLNNQSKAQFINTINNPNISQLDSIANEVDEKALDYLFGTTKDSSPKVATEEEQARFLDKIANKVISNSKKSQEQVDAISKELVKATEELSKATSKIEVKQIQGKINTLNAILEKINNSLIADKNTMYLINERKKASEIYKSQQANATLNVNLARDDQLTAEQKKKRDKERKSPEFYKFE